MNRRKWNLKRWMNKIELVHDVLIPYVTSKDFTFITAQYMHQSVNVNICNFAAFGMIFMKFSPKGRANEKSQ